MNPAARKLSQESPSCPPWRSPRAEPIIGIDLGTTNSEVAIVGADGQPHVCEEDGDPILPSFVGLSDDGRPALVGARRRAEPVGAGSGAHHQVDQAARWARTCRSSSAIANIDRRKSPP